MHLGACTSTTCTDATYFLKNNYEYPKILAQFALKRKIPFLYASSAATYGSGEDGFSDEDKVSLQLKPLNIYGYSKQLFDLWLIKNGLVDKVTGFSPAKGCLKQEADLIVTYRKWYYTSAHFPVLRNAA